MKNRIFSEEDRTVYINNSDMSLLGLTYGFSKKELKRKYREKSKENHPDKGGDAEIMKSINSAYEMLLKRF
jgi:DnaJ-class molecular chaperone